METNRWIPIIVFISALSILTKNQLSFCQPQLQQDLRQQQQQQQQDYGDSISSIVENGTIADQVIEALYDCRFHYAHLPESFTNLSVYFLVLGGQSNGEKSNQKEFSITKKSMRKIDQSSRQLLLLDKLDLDIELPFIFFTNGFNHDGILYGTWMEDVARVYMSRYSINNNTTAINNNVTNSNSNKWRNGGKANVVFLSWHLKTLLANDALSVIPVYYKTMANYDIIVGRFQDAIQQIIDHVDKLRSLRNPSRPHESNKDYFGKFRFYGHSLGSHIIAHALNGLHKCRPELKFDQIYGLDPAVPCFSNDQQGLAASKTRGIVREVNIIHSNAGILGAFSDRGQIEIVLNGGTFQPNCSFYDLTCHHVRSTDIFGYIDDNCKMVAYKCNKYEQFKLGACETCDSTTTTNVSMNSFGDNKNISSTGGLAANCILVNLDEQNRDSQLISSVSTNEQVRQLADNDGDGNDVYNYERAHSIGSKLALLDSRDHMKNAKAEYHFVNTNSKFRETPTKSHCLQHYQLRLLTLDSGEKGQNECKLNLLHGDGVNVQLFSEPSYSSMDSILSRHRDQITVFKLTSIIKDKLHTGLGTFEGKPQLFVGAIIDNINLKSWSECFLRNKQKEIATKMASKELILDIAFMSHTRKSVRYAFSSVLCAHWPEQLLPDDTRTANNVSTTTLNDDQGYLVLNLCRQSELTDVSNSVDQLIRQVKFHNQFEPWHVVLLNSLFSLFSGWEPL